MSINYAEKYASQIDERFALESLTAGTVDDNFDFVGVKTVNVYSIPTAEMNDYTRSGSQRYGSPAELENTVQELTLSKDRSFTFTIDRGNFNETMMASSAGAALQRQLREVVIPEIDIYRLSKMASSAGTKKSAAITADNAYDAFLDAQLSLTNAKVPAAGRIAFVSPSFHKAIKLDNSFIKNGDISQKTLMTGQIGELDGTALVLVPDSYLPSNTAFILTAAKTEISPVKLADYKIHDNPPGINGWLVEGRVCYDAFVLNNKKNAVYIHLNKTA